MLSAFEDLILSRRRALALALLGSAAVGSFTVACGSSGTPEPDPLEEQLKAARRDADLATAAAKAAPPPTVPALTVLAAERARHAAALVEELARAAGKPTPTESETPSSQAPSPTAKPAAPPSPPPGVDDVIKALRESAASAAKLAPTLSGYRAGLLGSIAAACATSLAVGFTPAERHR